MSEQQHAAVEEIENCADNIERQITVFRTSISWSGMDSTIVNKLDDLAFIMDQLLTLVRDVAAQAERAPGEERGHG